MVGEKTAGRPKKHADGRERVKAYRERQRHQGRRIDAYVDNQASWRLKRLAAAWGCSLGQAVTRLVMEADGRYNDILFPETECDQEP